MRFKTKKKIPVLVIAAIGLVYTLVMLFGRLAAESKDRFAACAMGYEDLLDLSRQSGEEPSAWLEALKDAGLHYLIVTDENEAEGIALAKECGLKTGRSGERAREGDAFLMPSVEEGYPVAYEVPLGDSSVPLILVENTTRTSVVMPEGFDPEKTEKPLVKGFYMYPDYSDSYEETEGPCESENIMFRAVLERGMRLVIVTPLYCGEDMVTEMSAYTDMLEGLSRRIGARGLALGETFSALSAPVLNPWLLGGALLLAAAMLTLLLSLVFPLSYKLEWGILAILAAVAVGGAAAMPELAQKLGAFMGAAIFPCFAAVALTRAAEGEGLLCRYRSLFLRACLLLMVILLAGFAGGLYVGALLGTRSYMLGFSVFYGVKLSQLLPLGFSFLLLAYALLIKRPRDSRPLSFKSLWPKGLLLVICMAAILLVLMLRSGDTALPIAALEKRGRDWLEQTLYARPRTKEMLLAFPAIGVFVFACKKQSRLLQLLLGSIVSIGCVSVVNTFCHIVAPIRVSLLRTLLSGGIGLCFALILLGLLMLLFLLYGQISKQFLDIERLSS